MLAHGKELEFVISFTCMDKNELKAACDNVVPRLKKERYIATMLMYNLARVGDLVDVKSLVENGCPVKGEMCVIAAKNNLDVFKYLYRMTDRSNVAECAAAAAGAGRLDIVMYLHKKKYCRDWRMCAAAANGGHLDILKYLHKNGYPWNEFACSNAASMGNLDILKYLHENGCEWNFLTFQYACEEGHMGVIEYLYANKCPWNERMYTATQEMDVVRFLFENKCPVDSNACTHAALHGNLDILKYLCENGCPIDSDTHAAARLGGYPKILNYLSDK